MIDTNGIVDEILSEMTFGRGTTERLGLKGHGVAILLDASGDLKAAASFENLVTQVGDQLYGERGAGIVTTPLPTGMQLGTGTTAVAKTGAGAAIVTLVANSLVATDGGFPASSLQGSARRIQYRTTYAAGTATANGIAEVALVNQATATQTAAPAANTIARALFASVINKTATDTLVVTWNHDLLGA